MKVISNTSPLIALSKIGQLSLLEKLFGKIIIPQSVHDEFLQNCTSAEQQMFLSACHNFIEVVRISDLCSFSRRLDKGEQEVLTLAIHEKADIVLLDDRKAYKEATDLFLKAASTRAVLKIAEEKHYISSMSKLEKNLRIKNFFLPEY
jgi:predicted nucleic acid-binding protein